jgi:hypothetical protein
MSIKPSELLKPNKDIMNKFVHNYVGMTQFYIDPIEMQNWATKGELGKTMMQFKPFGVQQQKLINRRILKPMKNGNFAPLARYLGFNIPAGAAMTWVKFKGVAKLYNAIVPESMEMEERGRETEIADVIENPRDIVKYAYESMKESGGFGILSDITDSAKYAESPQEYLIKSAGGVSAGEVWDIGELIAKYGEGMATGDLSYANEQLSKYLLKQVPIVGPYLKQGLYPYDPKSSQFYDVKDDAKLSSLRKEDIDEATKTLRSGGDMSNTSLAGAISNKIDSLKKKQEDDGISRQKEIDKLIKIAEKYKINTGTAAKYSENYKDSKKDLKESMSDEEKALENESKSFVLNYLKEKGKKLEDYPKLKAYVDKYGW